MQEDEAEGHRTRREKKTLRGSSENSPCVGIINIIIHIITTIRERPHLGFRPEIFSVLLGPDRLWYESRSVLLSLLDGADTEMVWPRGRWPPPGEIGPGWAGPVGNSSLILAPPTTAGPSTS